MVVGFLEALFGSLCFGVKLADDKVNNSEHDKMLLSREQIRSVLTNRKKETELGSMARENGWDWVINQIPTSDLQFIFGDDWERIINDYKSGKIEKYNFNKLTFLPRDDGAYHCFRDINSILFNVLASQHGIILHNRMYNGYQTGYAIDGVDFERREITAKKVCIVIERNIKSNHPNINIRIENNPSIAYMMRWDY